MGITIIGLGPGGGRFLTREAWEKLSSAEIIYLRTSRHPTTPDLPPGVPQYSFDYLYEAADDFAEVYEQITAELLRKGKEGDVVYAVPGHPNVGESTSTMLIERAKNKGVSVEVVSGISFVEPVLAALDLDALDGLQIYDALAVATYLYPPCNPNTSLLLAQVYSRLVASEIKSTLSAVYPEQHMVILVHKAGEPNEILEHLPLYAIDRSENIGHLTSLFVPPLEMPSNLAALAETVAILRSPEGCPWDIEQTPQSMRDGFLEEAYEVLQALDSEDSHNLREELGDLLYHLVMQAQMASEFGDFTISEVIAGIDAKLKRRHPHVWGDVDVHDSAEVIKNWELIKETENGGKPKTHFDGLPKALPALAKSQKIQDRVGKIGFDWPEIDGVYDKINEEIREIKAAQSQNERQAELGDLLFIIVNLSRWLDLDAESSLREANLRFIERFQIVEQLASSKDLNLGQLNLDQMEELWEEAKESLAKVNSDAKV